MEEVQKLLTISSIVKAFCMALKKFIIDEKVENDIMDEFFAQVDCVSNYPAKIVVVKGKYEEVCFPVKDIVWIEADRCYTIFHLLDGRKKMMTGNLIVVLRQLCTNGCVDFLRIHKSYAVNINYVNSKFGNRIRVGKTNLTIGRYYRPEFEKHCIFINKLG